MVAQGRTDVEGILALVSGPQLVSFVHSLVGGELVRAGREHKVLCPFHDDHKPSLTINHEKRATGILCCFTCQWSGSIVDFVGDFYRIEGEKDGLPEFIRRVRKIGELVGQKVPERPAGAPARRDKVESQTVLMTPREVAQAWQAMGERAVDPAPYADKLGIDPRAMALAGAMVVPHGYWTPAGWAPGNPDRMLLTLPMRRPDLVMISAQFRCFANKRKWALDEKMRTGGEWVQVKHTSGGLFLCTEAPADLTCYHLVVVEGMTDFLGGLTIMLRSFGEDMVEWPCQFAGLPGVSSMHEMVVQLKPARATTFFDADQAGIMGSFDTRRRRVKRDAAGNVIKDASGKPVSEVDLATDRRQGLVGLLRAAGVDARASRPPRVQGGKFDLRDMAREGWDYWKFEDHLMRTSTRDLLGLRFRR